MKRIALLLLVLWAAPLRADPEDAVCRVPSHGGSCVVIATGEGWSLLLSAGHLTPPGESPRAFALDVPVPAGKGPHKKVGISVVAVDGKADLLLLRLNHGPLPYVAPVAPAGHKIAKALLSVGYDEMKLPGQRRKATVVAVDAGWIYTAEKPWHGRSGGALLDGPYTVGIVSGYEGEPARVNGKPVNVEYDGRHRGVYVSHAAILKFLDRAGVKTQRPPVVSDSDDGQPYFEQRYPLPQAYQQPQGFYAQPRPRCPT